ncbi:MAG: hypothetical protein KGY81_08095 [Phycisphaerae bacterium]|nr:hypothetical protein [Phycisphaerae bacterium]
MESYLRVKGEHKWECACRVSGNTWGFGGPRPMLALPQVEAETFAEAMATYWQVYYDLVDEYVKCWPDKVRVFPTDALNTEEGVREILRFVGVEQPVVKTGIRRHASRPNTSLFMS